jgi:hypothetical protein
MTIFQELAHETFRDLLRNTGGDTDLKAALRESARVPGLRYGERGTAVFC